MIRRGRPQRRGGGIVSAARHRWISGVGGNCGFVSRRIRPMWYGANPIHGCTRAPNACNFPYHFPPWPRTVRLSTSDHICSAAPGKHRLRAVFPFRWNLAAARSGFLLTHT